MLRITANMLSSGLVAVDLASSGSGCRPWDEQGAEDAIRRVTAEWDSLGHEPSVGDIVWFNDSSSTGM